MNKFNEDEFFSICERFNVQPYSEEVVINCSAEHYFNKMKNIVKEDRRGEVVFCVVRPSGKVILVTCEEYPPEVYRIPTGGIKHGEDIIKAVYREAKEELGLMVEITDFIGVLKIEFKFKNDFVMFYSYLFILKESGGRLLEDAEDDEISEVKEADLKEFQEALGILKNICGKWEDWGRFRYETSRAVLNYLRNNSR